MTGKKITRIGSCLLVLMLLITMLPINVFAYSVDLSQSKVFKTDYFSADFSSGYIKNNAAATGHGSGMTEIKRAEDWGIDFYILNNTAKDSNIYMDFANAAVSDGVSYDIRMYTWLDHAYSDGGVYGVYTNKIGVATYPVLRGGENIYALETNSIHIEMHFYKGGSLASGNPQEVNWEGVVRFADLDTNEGYIFENNSCNRVYTANASDTTIAHSMSFYYGTQTVNYGSTAGDDSNYNGAIWAELGSTSSKPLTLQYRNSGRFGSEIGYQGVNVKYNIVGEVPAGVTNWPSSYAAEYSNVYVKGTPNCSNSVTNANYTFSGWYTNSNFTGNPVSSTTTVDSTTRNLYGRYIRTAYTVTTSREGSGTITESRNGIQSGSNYTVNFTPSSGYYVYSVTIDGVAQTNPNSLRNYTFSNIKADHEISVVFKPLLTLTTSATNGTISSSDNAIIPGSNRTVTFNPNEGYYLSSLTVNGSEVNITPTTSSYQLNNITSNQTVNATFSPLLIIDTNVTNGTITDDQTGLYPNSDVTIDYSANDGFYLANILVDGQSITYTDFLTQYVFNDITTNHSIDVTYNPYLSLSTNAINGSITGDDNRIKSGEERTVTFSPNDGYALASLTINEAEIEIDRLATSYVVSDIKSNTEVVAIFEPVYTINTEVIGGTISNPISNIFAGESVDISYSPDGENELQRILIDGEEVDLAEIENGYTFTNISENHTIKVIYNGIGQANIHFVDNNQTEIANTILVEDFYDELVGEVSSVESNINAILSKGYKLDSREAFEEGIFGEDELDFYITFSPIIEEITVDNPKTNNDEMNTDGTPYPSGLDIDSLTDELTRTIYYKYEETGEEASTSVVQTVVFNRIGYVNHVTGEVWYDDYTTEDVYDSAESPEIRNFTATLSEVPSRVPVYEDGDIIETVLYVENDKQISNLLFVDTNGKQLSDTLTTIGHPEENIIFEYDNIIEELENIGYILKTDEYSDTEVFDNDYDVNQDFRVIFEPLIITYSVDNEGIAGTPANSNRPDGRKVPENLLAENFTYNINRTIQYRYDISSPRYATNPVAAENVVQHTAIYREATVNYVTMEITYSDWEIPEIILDGKNSPTIEHFTADRNINALTKLNDTIVAGETLSITETVIYTPKQYNVIVRFIDENGTQLTESVVYTGNYETSVIFDNRINQTITNITNKSYELVRNETTNLNISFIGGDQIYNVVFKKVSTPTSTTTPTTPTPVEIEVPATGDSMNVNKLLGLFLISMSMMGIGTIIIIKNKEDYE